MTSRTDQMWKKPLSLDAPNQQGNSYGVAHDRNVATEYSTTAKIQAAVTSLPSCVTNYSCVCGGLQLRHLLPCQVTMVFPV